MEQSFFIIQSFDFFNNLNIWLNIDCLFCLRKVIEKMFDVFDIDGNEKISKEEMKTVVKDLAILFENDKDINYLDLFKEMDENHDDQIDKQEFVSSIMNQNVYGQNLALKLQQIYSKVV